MTLPIQLPDFEGRASCAEIDPELWFPEKGGTAVGARRVCAGCEIRPQCLEWALSTKEPHGVWGGLTPLERARLNRKRKVRPISHGTEGGYKTHKRRGEQACAACLAANALKNREWAATHPPATTQQETA